MTNEGPRAVHVLINFLKNASPVGPLKMDNNLVKAVKDHVKDTGRTGRTGHYGSDGSSPFSRLKRYT